MRENACRYREVSEKNSQAAPNRARKCPGRRDITYPSVLYTAFGSMEDLADALQYGFKDQAERVEEGYPPTHPPSPGTTYQRSVGLWHFSAPGRGVCSAQTPRRCGPSEHRKTGCDTR